MHCKKSIQQCASQAHEWNYLETEPSKEGEVVVGVDLIIIIIAFKGAI